MSGVNSYPTKAQLEKFIETRHESGFMTNMQFCFDAAECGFSADDLGTPDKLGDGHYQWRTPHGTLVERWGMYALLTD